MKNFFELDFFENPLKSDFVFPEISTSIKFDDPRIARVWNYRDKELLNIVNPDIAKWAKGNKLKLESMYIFLTSPGFRTVIHTDSASLNFNPVVINWVKDAIPDSYTIWYKPKDEFGTDLINCIDSKYTNNIYYLKMDDSKMEEVERHTLTGPTLICVNTPHQAVNESNQQRWTISLRFHNNFGEWSNIVEWFKPYIKTC
jgi:hypothetical protein